MTPARKRNLIRLPLVLFIRVPLLLPFYALERIGAGAEFIGQLIARRIPGLEPEPTPSLIRADRAPEVTKESHDEV